MQDDPQTSSPNTTRRGRHFAIATVAGFMLAVWLPLIGLWILPRPTLSFTEKRFLAKWPTLEATRAGIESWPGRVEAWYDDHLGFRDWLIASWARLHFQVFGISPAYLTIVGKDGWLFLGQEDAIAHYRGLDPLSGPELEHWRHIVEERRDWLADRDIAYLLVLVPDKHLIYGEYMPDALSRVSSVHPLDQLASHLQSTTDVDVLDLRPALTAAKQRDRVYHKTDSHWNDLGAYEAYRAMHTRLEEILPALKGRPAARVERGLHYEPGMGLAGTVALVDLFPEEVLEANLVAPRAVLKSARSPTGNKISEAARPIVYEQPDRGLPRAVMFRDSFGNALIPYVAEDFSRIVYVWDRDIDPDMVLRERPDIVIQEIVSRFLGRRPRGIEEVKQQPPRRFRR